MSRGDAANPSVSPRSTVAPKSGGLYGWRLWSALVLLLILAVATLRAGFWQLSRADEKRALLAEIQSADALGALPLSPTVADDELVEWRQAWARGHWQPGWTVLLQNRNHEGVPGYWVVTPLCLESPDAPEPDLLQGRAIDCDAAVAVLRGWFAHRIGARGVGDPGGAQGHSHPSAVSSSGPADSHPDRPSQEWDPSLELEPGAGADEHATVEGRLLARIPRIFELGSITGAAEAPLNWESGVPVVQNLDLDSYAHVTGLSLLPAVLQQSHGDDALVRSWAGPALDVDTNLGYALQWFSFAAIALIAFGVILGKAFKNRRRH